MKTKLTKIPLFDLKVSQSARRQVAETLASGWLNTGPKVKEFEGRISALMNVRYGVGVNSCTAGLTLALKAVGVRRGKQVITSPFTFVATVEAIVHAGGTPVFADIDPVRLNIDPESVARKVNSRTAAILPVDMAGHLVDYPALKKIAAERQIPIVADAAHAVAGSYRGRSSAGWADAAVLSFHATKNLTCGEGGMVLTRKKAIADAVRSMSHHGLSSTAHERKSSRLVGYDAIEVGHKGNMSELHAAVGLGQLECFEREQEHRNNLVSRYQRNLADMSDFLEIPVQGRGYQHGWHLYHIKLHLSHLRIDRDRFLQLMANHGIECGVHYRPVFELACYSDIFSKAAGTCPNASEAGRRVVSLPLYAGLKLNQVDRVCEAMRRVLSKSA